jgi:hypothetical protein
MESGWLAFNFKVLQERRPAIVEFQRFGKNREVEVDHQMNEEVKVTHFDILYINREQTCPEQFPVRVTFLSEAAKLVVQKCEEQQTMKNDQRLVRWIKRLLSFVSEVEEEKCFNPLVVTSPGQSKHASRKHPERLQDV